MTTGAIKKRAKLSSSIFWVTVLAGMASLVIMVAVLQYRWTKQLIEATEADMGNRLRPLTTGWHLDFYGELSAICVALQVGPDSGCYGSTQKRTRPSVQWFLRISNLCLVACNRLLVRFRRRCVPGSPREPPAEKILLSSEPCRLPVYRGGAKQ